jgi:hypothetical protein
MNLQIANPQISTNTAQLYLKTVLKMFFLNNFFMFKIELEHLTRKSMYFAEVLSLQTKKRVGGPQNDKLFKFADLRFAELICGPPTFGVRMMCGIVKAKNGCTLYLYLIYQELYRITHSPVRSISIRCVNKYIISCAISFKSSFSFCFLN